MQRPASAATSLEDLCRRGLALHRAGRLDEARESYQQVLARDPRRYDALHLLGALLVQIGEAGPAVPLIRRAIAVNSGPAEPHCLLGVALAQLARPAEALAAYDRAIALAPAYAEAHFNRGRALSDLKRHEAALEGYDRAIGLRPGYVNALVNRGLALIELRRLDLALDSFERAIALAPALAAAHDGRGVALTRLRRPLDALVSFDRAIGLNPRDPAPHINRGLALCDLGRYAEALTGYDTALALAPDFADAWTDRGMVHLLQGRFDDGWAGFEWRHRKSGPPRPGLDPRRLWRGGQAIAGRRLFVHHEQGQGDTIQFARYLPLLGDMGADLMVSVQDSLRELLRPLATSATFLRESQVPKHYDVHCSLMSLPLAFGTTLASIPSPGSYLRADPERRAGLAGRLDPTTGPRVGLAWSGNPSHANDHNRSLAFERLLPLLGSRAQWIAVQNNIRPNDAAAFADHGGVRFVGEALGDYADTAALIDLMDLVITVDTSVAHLAGALGKPVWILLPFGPDWRWLLGRADSPWYASARLFRQPAYGDWPSVIDAVGAALTAGDL